MLKSMQSYQPTCFWMNSTTVFILVKILSRIYIRIIFQFFVIKRYNKITAIVSGLTPVYLPRWRELSFADWAKLWLNYFHAIRTAENVSTRYKGLLTGLLQAYFAHFLVSRFIEFFLCFRQLFFDLITFILHCLQLFLQIVTSSCFVVIGVVLSIGCFLGLFRIIWK